MSQMEFLLNLVLSAVASLVAVAIWLYLDRFRLPDLEIELEPGGPRKHDVRRFLHVRVSNKPSMRFLGFLFPRSPALMCRAHLTFYTDEFQLIFQEGHVMRGRWVSTPEPLAFVPLQGGIVEVPAPGLARDYVDIPPGDFEALDVVMRRQEETECRGWNNGVYLTFPNPRPEHAFPLPTGRFNVQVVVRSGGREWSRVFRIMNDQPIEHFRLETVERPPRLTSHKPQYI